MFPVFDVMTIDYGYDGLSRLLTANYDGGAVEYTYGYDVAGNLVNNNGVTRTYNAANQMTNDGANALTYDNNGNLRNDGVNTYTWDRANRMLTAPGSTSYKYDGASNRISQTVSGVVTAYLNDVQPGLTQLLAETVLGNTTRYVQGVRGIHATESHAGVWSYFAQDDLGSVRGIFDNAAAVVSSQVYNPMGVPATDYGKGFGFTGEYTDANDLLYLRARYYAPSKGVFTALDPFEGMYDRPMSLNGYSWVEGNPVMNVDPTGMICEGLTGTALHYCRTYMDCDYLNTLPDVEYRYSTCFDAELRNPAPIIPFSIASRNCLRRGDEIRNLPIQGCKIELASWNAKAEVPTWIPIPDHSFLIFTPRGGSDEDAVIFRGGKKPSIPSIQVSVEDNEGADYERWIIRNGPRILLEAGEDTCTKLSCLWKLVHEIHELEVTYSISGPNSNTVVGTFATLCSIPLAPLRAFGGSGVALPALYNQDIINLLGR
jgi:RHS repeat-associated protein